MLNQIVVLHFHSIFGIFQHYHYKFAYNDDDDGWLKKKLKKKVERVNNSFYYLFFSIEFNEWMNDDDEDENISIISLKEQWLNE